MKRTYFNSFAAALLLIFAIFMQRQLFGDEYKYYSKGRRDPFIPLVTGDIRTALGLSSVETIEDIEFEGIIFDPSGNSIVVLNGELVKEREQVYNVEVVRICDSTITLKIYDKVHTINLVEEGGETVER